LPKDAVSPNTISKNASLEALRKIRLDQTQRDGCADIATQQFALAVCKAHY
jgi:hypothetical protein